MNDLNKKLEKKPAVKRMTVSPVRFAPLLSELPTSAVTGVLGNLELVKDVKMNVTVELGRTNLPLKEVLQLGENSVIKLDRLAGESIDLLVNGRLIARGEVVVIGNNFGIKITEVHRPESLMSGDDSGYE
ncbi:MAG: flagellar motor switch protein FliN [Candidatus Sericytochromatia bacterium]|nr:flagellar motor switch protein FliN [Candidatus Sericytochromatia bacterium]